jgi:hypothetical protein
MTTIFAFEPAARNAARYSADAVDPISPSFTMTTATPILRV